MKKIISLFVLAILTLACAVGFAACGEPSDELPTWNGANDGTYYFYKDGAPDQSYCFVIADGKITAWRNDEKLSVEMTVAESGVTITVAFNGHDAQKLYGTIGGGTLSVSRVEKYYDGELTYTSTETEYYCKEGITPPDIEPPSEEPSEEHPENPSEEPEWNSELNGTYYRVLNDGLLSDDMYIELNDGEAIFLSMPAKVEIDGADITLEISSLDTKMVLTGTIENDIINLISTVLYDENDEILFEGVSDWQLKKSATPPVYEQESIVIWVDSQAYMRWCLDVASEFREEYVKEQQSKLSVTVAIVDPENIYSDYDAEKGAPDIIFFDGRYLPTLKDNGTLLALDDEYAKRVQENDIGYMAEAATIDGRLYAFPSTVSSLFVWYDTEIFDATDVLTLDGMLEKAKSRGVKISIPDDALYNRMFFESNGCTFGYGDDGAYFTDINGQNGYDAAAALYKYRMDGTIVGGDARVGGDVAACISDSRFISEALKDYEHVYATAKLPTVTIADEQVRLLSPLYGYFCGVNADTENAELAAALAAYLTDASAQSKLFDECCAVPTNKYAAEEKAQDMIVQTTGAQISAGVWYCTLQPTEIEQGLGADCVENFDTAENIKAYLDSLAEHFGGTLSSG